MQIEGDVGHVKFGGVKVDAEVCRLKLMSMALKLVDVQLDVDVYRLKFISVALKLDVVVLNSMLKFAC